ncbi:Aste57867_2259 [Aphanomyces stellatus]|uniref:Aste57867_2259 protein n=1 Tax=Aphanomyces stellatus TaxID=120398 RepID=A0A485KBH6_9STRA|nr:hypothetical protein As57867_002254 [Aphanomyces stellatus]VFT79462.1 Aste57867_2259 [Aphanomyces stellatus]
MPSTQQVQRALRAWSPSHYLQFASQRLRPALDLLNLVNVPPTATTVVDLGSGPGNLTPFLRERFPTATIECVDASDSMLAAAAATHKELGLADVRYTQANFESFEPSSPVDVIYTNAALHWVSFDVHTRLLPRLVSFLKPGGVLAIQMPDSRKMPSHQLMGQAAADLGMDVSSARWVTTEADAGAYYKLLAPLGSEIHLWSTEYVYTMTASSDSHPVVDFVSSTGLGPYLNALEPSQHPAFLAKYTQLIANAYPVLPNGVALVPYRRFFCVLTK